MIVRASRSTTYSERHRPDLQDSRKISRFDLCSIGEAWAHQKFTGLYLFATIWMTKRAALSKVANTDAVPSLKCAERYCKVEASKADLRRGIKLTFKANSHRGRDTGKVLRPPLVHAFAGRRLPTEEAGVWVR